MAKSPIQRMRLDQRLVFDGLSASLVEAQALVMAGKVIVNDQRASFSSELISPSDIIRVKQSRFVSRGGEKLCGIIAEFSLKEAFKEKRVLDIGSSTGGFTDCCLQYGAKEVLAVDVGTSLLHSRLRQDKRVRLFEQQDIRNFALPADCDDIDWILADISFNKLSRLFCAIAPLIKEHTQILLLIKPQFELPATEVPVGGIVLTDEKRKKAIDLVTEEVARWNVKVLGVKESPVRGRHGNQEYFLWGKR